MHSIDETVILWITIEFLDIGDLFSFAQVSGKFRDTCIFFQETFPLFLYGRVFRQINDICAAVFDSSIQFLYGGFCRDLVAGTTPVDADIKIFNRWYAYTKIGLNQIERFAKSLCGFNPLNRNLYTSNGYKLHLKLAGVLYSFDIIFPKADCYMTINHDFDVNYLGLCLSDYLEGNTKMLLFSDCIWGMRLFDFIVSSGDNNRIDTNLTPKMVLDNVEYYERENNFLRYDLTLWRTDRFKEIGLEMLDLEKILSNIQKKTCNFMGHLACNRITFGQGRTREDILNVMQTRLKKMSEKGYKILNANVADRFINILEDATRTVLNINQTINFIYGRPLDSYPSRENWRPFVGQHYGKSAEHFEKKKHAKQVANSRNANRLAKLGSKSGSRTCRQHSRKECILFNTKV